MNKKIISEKNKKNNKNKTEEIMEICEQIWQEKMNETDLMQTKDGRIIKFGPYRTYIKNAIEETKKKKQSNPKWRINVIFGGTGGSGKSTIASRLAYLLSNQKDKGFLLTDYIAGFDEYDNEKTIIFEEFELNDVNEYGVPKFLKITDNNENNNFSINIKYGTIKLSNNYNIITTNEDTWEFLEKLSKNYSYDKEMNSFKVFKNPEKITRRFPYIFIFDKKESLNDIYITKIQFYEFESNLKDESFKSKYRLVKTWEYTTTEDNFKNILKPFLNEVYVFIQKKKEILENKILNDEKEWLNDAKEIINNYKKQKK